VGSDIYKSKEQNVHRFAAYLGFGFLSLVDLRNGICTAEGSTLMDDNVLSDELAGDLVGEFAGDLQRN